MIKYHAGMSALISAGFTYDEARRSLMNVGKQGVEEEDDSDVRGMGDKVRTRTPITDFQDALNREGRRVKGKSPYFVRKDEVTIEGTGEHLALWESRRLLMRSTYTRNLVKLNPGQFNQKSLMKEVQNAYPHMSASGLASWISCATHGTGAFKGVQVFRTDKNGGLHLL